MQKLITKNVLIHLLLLPFYFFASSEIAQIAPEKLDTLLLFVGLIVIAPVTSNFIFSYENSKDNDTENWGHYTTFFSMLVIGMLFVVLDILLLKMVGNVLTFRLSILVFWIAVITFDFADFAKKKS